MSGRPRGHGILDMSSGYYQIELSEDDMNKTAFITKYGLFEYRRMPFDLCNAPATFQRAMSPILRGLEWGEVLAYLDDIIILGKSFEDSMKNLMTVFERFRSHNLQLKAKKCQLFKRKVIFLGKQIISEGVSPNPNSIETLRNWPVPTGRKDVERFLGFLNYHRAHIKNCAQVVSLLYDLTKKKLEMGVA